MSTTLGATGVVLDTNVVLDLLVFDDPRTRPLGDALRAGTLVAWADAHTLRELELVLALPHFAARAGGVHARYRALVSLADADGALPPLPRCKDRDDQKFLELAARSGAAWLVSKDHLLLCLAGRHDLPFAILTVAQAVRALGAPRP